MKYYVKSLLILLLSLCLIVLVYPPFTAKVHSYLSNAIFDNKRPAEVVAFMAVCDGEPEFISALATTNILYGGHYSRMYALPDKRSISWVKPNCSVVIVSSEGVDTLDRIKPFENTETTTLLPGLIYYIASLLTDTITPLSPEDILAGGEKYAIYYYTDTDLSGDFTSEERVNIDGFLPEHVRWLVSDDYMRKRDYNRALADRSKYPKSDAQFIKFANIQGGPFDGRSLYVISIQVPDQNDEE